MNLFMNKFMRSETKMFTNYVKISMNQVMHKIFMKNKIYVSWTSGFHKLIHEQIHELWKRLMNFMNLFMNRCHKDKYRTFKRQVEKYFNRTNNGNLIITEKNYFRKTSSWSSWINSLSSWTSLKFMKGEFMNTYVVFMNIFI